MYKPFPWNYRGLKGSNKSDLLGIFRTTLIKAWLYHALKTGSGFNEASMNKPV